MQTKEDHAPGPPRLPTANDIERLGLGIAKVRQSLTVVAAPAVADEQVRFAPEEGMRLALEELTVAEEELRAQHEELDLTRLRLEEEKTRYHALFCRAPVPYIVTDPNGVIREANDAAAAFLRVPARRLSGKPLAVFTAHEAQASLGETLRALRNGKSAREVRLSIRPRDGKETAVVATASPAHSPREGVVELGWLLVDASEAEKREREAASRAAELENRVAERTAELEAARGQLLGSLLQTEESRRAAVDANRATSDLLAVVSHELRTPLAAIGGYSELLLLGVYGDVAEDQRTQITRMQDAQRHMLALLDDLLTYFKIGAGRLRVEVDDARLGDVLTNVDTFVRPQAESRGVAILMSAEDPDVAVKCDIERTRQIVINLLANAVKFTRPGGEIRLTADADDRFGLIHVSDNGIGIPGDRIESVFAPFTAMSGGRSQTGSKGAGLGLAISRDLARAMGGDLTAESGDRGSTFTLRLPRRDSPG